jgi:transposase InsO family protein
VESRFGPDGKPLKPIEWLTDNGSLYTAAETRSFSKQLGLKPVTSPQSNGMAESFVKTLKRDYVFDDNYLGRLTTTMLACSGRVRDAGLPLSLRHKSKVGGMPRKRITDHQMHKWVFRSNVTSDSGRTCACA